MNKITKNILIIGAVAIGGYFLYKQYLIMQDKLKSQDALKNWNKQHN